TPIKIDGTNPFFPGNRSWACPYLALIAKNPLFISRSHCFSWKELQFPFGTDLEGLPFLKFNLVSPIIGSGTDSQKAPSLFDKRPNPGIFLSLKQFMIKGISSSRKDH